MLLSVAVELNYRSSALINMLRLGSSDLGLGLEARRLSDEKTSGPRVEIWSGSQGQMSRSRQNVLD